MSVGGSAQLRAVRLLVRSAPLLAVGAAVFVLADAALPALTLAAMGRATGDIPAAVRAGMASPAGRRLDWALAVAGLLYAVFMVRGPVQDVLNVSSDDQIDSVSIYNVLGQQVLSKTIHANEGKVDVSALGAGSYFVKMASGEQVKTLKVIKQ